MINLIGNEIKKVFKKKTIYILLIITLAFMIFLNIMVKNIDSDYHYYYYSDGDIEFYEDMMSQLDLENNSELAEYIEYKIQLKILKLTKEYGNDTWQSFVINTKMISDISTIINYEYYDEITEEEYNTAKSSYDTAIQKLESDDWRYFVNKDLEEINSSLEEQYTQRENISDEELLSSIDDIIYDLELRKQVNEWRLEKDISYAPSFLNSKLETYYYGMSDLASYDSSQLDELESYELQYYEETLASINLAKYYVENSIILDNDGRDIFLELFTTYELFIILVGIVIAGTIVSDEFNKGTIKLLLVKPYTRTKILLSKLIVCMLILALTIILIAAFQLLIGGIVFGFDGLDIPYIYFDFDTNQVETINVFAYTALTGICKLPISILLTTLAFTCSTLFTSNALGIALPFLGYMASNSINDLAIAFDVKQLIYFVTPNWDLTYYLFGGTPLFKELTLPFSICICVIYLIIMIIISLLVFKKRDIKNI